ncbi:MAG TPA: hypothetical protein VHE12_03360 [bacterium]|nr:hypothetical protein [bacterium]
MPITDAEKQIRFRKKEALKRQAENAFKHLQLSLGLHRQHKTPQEIKIVLDQAIELPSGWTDEDYVRAQQKLQQIFHDIVSMPDELKNDVDEGAYPSNKFRTTPDPMGFIKEEKLGVEKTRALASHLISALNLSNCNDAEKAAAVLEAVRTVGRTVANQQEVPRSAATAVCLATLGPHYERPKWFAKRMAKALISQLDQKLSKELGHLLIEQNRNLFFEDEGLS